MAFMKMCKGVISLVESLPFVETHPLLLTGLITDRPLSTWVSC